MFRRGGGVLSVDGSEDDDEIAFAPMTRLGFARDPRARRAPDDQEYVVMRPPLA